MSEPTQAPLARWQDQAQSWLERQSARLSRGLRPPPFLAELTRVEQTIASDVFARNAAAVADAGQDFLASLALSREGRGEPNTAPMEAIAERMIGEVRARMECMPWDRPLLGLTARLDQRMPTSVEEFMDDARLTKSDRRDLVEALDRQTRRAGDYLVLVDLLLPLLLDVAGTPPTIFDIGSGPGGFPIALARAMKDVRVVASDVDTDYLALGRARAKRLGLRGAVEFRRVDAFRLPNELGNLRPEIITCTRTLHHFGIRGTTRLMALALHTATHGIFFVDIVRSISRMLMAAGAGIASGNLRFAHDAVVSVRKSFTPTELQLIAACVPGGAGLKIFYTAPAYIVARGRAAGS
jgi:SAM-dependent methyltransferase